MRKKENDFPVDIVVLWVDGNDSEWKKEKAMYAPIEEGHADLDCRYRDWNLMKYWFRGIDVYAPWVRTVHFVTWGHLPDFLNTNSPKLHIVNHKDFMPAEALPTYSSMALEMNLHRIPDLAERFVYFNDDMFLTKKTKKSDFFDLKSGLPRMPFLEMPTRYVGVTPWQVTVALDVGIVNKHLKKKDVPITKYPGKYISAKYTLAENIRNIMAKILYPEYYTGFKNYHSPMPFLKCAFSAVEQVEPKLLQSTTMHRFRDHSDLNQWVFAWWQLASGNFRAKKNGHQYFDTSRKNIQEICNHILSQDLESMCINDPDQLENFEELAILIREAFKQVLPQKSSFEV